MTSFDLDSSEAQAKSFISQSYNRLEFLIEEQLDCGDVDLSFHSPVHLMNSIGALATAQEETSTSGTVQLECKNSSKLTGEPPRLSDPFPSPFHHLESSTELLAEIWEADKIRRGFQPKKRGNYVRNDILSELRIDVKECTYFPVSWNLEALWNKLPFELIISIFSFLHPIDLYHAIRSTKGLRHFLLDKNSTSIWKESFLNHPEIPFYPDDVSAPKWTSWLFDPAICDVCGEDNSLFEYNYRHRKCNECMDYLFADELEMTNAIEPILGGFPGQEDILWKITMKTYRFTSLNYPSDYDENSAQYSLEEAIKQARVMRRYLVHIQAGVPGARASYENFVKVNEAASKRRMEDARRCEKWAYTMQLLSQSTFIDWIPPFCRRSQKVLLKRGRHPRDVEIALAKFAYTMAYHNGWPDLSIPRFRNQHVWTYLSQLESMVEQCKLERLEIERQRRICTRTKIITSFYSGFIKVSFTGATIPYLPKADELFDLQFFMDYVKNPKESIVELDAFTAATQILYFVKRCLDEKKRQLLKLLLNMGLLPQDVTEDSPPDVFLGLATAVFQCCDRIFIGWEEAGIHHCENRKVGLAIGDNAVTPYLFCFSDIGHQALKHLAELLHVNPRSARASDLDALNKRFICKTCNFSRHARMEGLYSMTWRECLNHALLDLPHFQLRHNVAFDILSEDVTKSILALEQPFPSPAEENWSCAHCCDNPITAKRADVISHVKSEHEIKKPVAGSDFAYCRTDQSPARNQLFVGLDENSNYRCLHCPKLKSLRLWCKDPALLCHLLDSHNVQSSDCEEGVDWRKVKAVEDDAWVREKQHV